MGGLVPGKIWKWRVLGRDEHKYKLFSYVGQFMSGFIFSAKPGNPFGGTATTLPQTNIPVFCAASPSPFGTSTTTHIFGQKYIPAFGNTTTTVPQANIPVFGGTTNTVPQTNIPAFGGTANTLPQANIPAFGGTLPQANTSVFGNTAITLPQANIPAFGGTLPQTNIPAFGGTLPQANIPAFGGTATTLPQTNIPAFTGTNIFDAGNPSTTNIFSQANIPAFGGTANTLPQTNIPAFGGTTNTVPQTNIPAFCGTANTLPQANIPAFGGTLPQANIPAFGGTLSQANIPAFGGTLPQANIPAFGGTLSQANISAFGDTAITLPQANIPAFGGTLPQTNIPAFGGTLPQANIPAFGGTATTLPQTNIPAFTGTNIFDAGNPSTTNIFSQANTGIREMETPKQINLECGKQSPFGVVPKFKVDREVLSKAEEREIGHQTRTSFDTPHFRTSHRLVPKLAVRNHSLFRMKTSKPLPITAFVPIKKLDIATDDKFGFASNNADRTPFNLPRFTKGSNYYCKPSIEELKKLVGNNNNYKISNFIIGKPDCGEIIFLAPVLVSDISGLELDKLVCFESSLVHAYEGQAAPPIGKGLNLPAKITFFDLPLPKKYKTNVVRFEKKIKDQIVKLGGHISFHSYDPYTTKLVLQAQYLVPIE